MRGIANPVAAMMSVALLLEQGAFPEQADRITQAIRAFLG